MFSISLFLQSKEEGRTSTKIQSNILTTKSSKNPYMIESTFYFSPRLWRLLVTLKSSVVYLCNSIESYFTLKKNLANLVRFQRLTLPNFTQTGALCEASKLTQVLLRSSSKPSQTSKSQYSKSVCHFQTASQGYKFSLFHHLFSAQQLSHQGGKYFWEFKVLPYN